jgi:GntR family transcriptional repressor for pyruvate dehydrogenase complex
VASIRSLEDPALLHALSYGVAPAGDQIADALRRAVTLRLFPEEKLPPERELARLFEVSRITVRQAIHTLREEGHLRSVSGRGGGTYQMLIPSSRKWRTRTEAALQGLMEIIEFRGLIEPLATRVAARRATRSLLGRLQRSVDEMALSASLEEFRHADSAFHLLIANATGNARLLQTIVVARADFLMWRDRLPIPFVPGHNVEEHAAIYEALRSRDGAAGEAAMAAHLGATKTDFRREIRRLGLISAPRVRRAGPARAARNGGGVRDGE